MTGRTEPVVKGSFKEEWWIETEPEIARRV